jgi:hypothetical protein
MFLNSQSASLSSKSKSESLYDLRFTANQFALASSPLTPTSRDFPPHLGLVTKYLLLFDSYGLVFCGAPSLTRGRVCVLYMLLALASAVFLGPESLGTRDRILLSQI